MNRWNIINHQIFYLQDWISSSFEYKCIPVQVIEWYFDVEMDSQPRLGLKRLATLGQPSSVNTISGLMRMDKGQSKLVYLIGRQHIGNQQFHLIIA